jgi:hypothetical protein
MQDTTRPDPDFASPKTPDPGKPQMAVRAEERRPDLPFPLSGCHSWVAVG